MPESHSLPKYFICGGLGRGCGIIAGYPLDTIKVRLQTMPVPAPGEPPLYTGTVDCLIKVLKTDGYKSLFRGVNVPLFTAVPLNSVMFCSYGIGQKIFVKDMNTPSMPELLLAGIFSGTIVSMLIVPVEHVKVLLQVKDDAIPKYTGPIVCLNHLYVQGGIRHLYKGTIFTLLKDIPATAAFFMTYDSMKEVISEKVGSSYKVTTSVLSGCFAGVSFWIVGMPGDNLKTRFQTAPKGKYGGLKDVLKCLMTNEGPTALYTGLAPVLIRTIPVNIMTFLGFELFSNIYDWVVTDL